MEYMNQKSLTQMDILLRLEDQINGNNNIIIISLKNAIKTKQPVSVIIATVKDMIADNEAAMSVILGQILLSKIKNYE